MKKTIFAFCLIILLSFLWISIPISGSLLRKTQAQSPKVPLAIDLKIDPEDDNAISFFNRNAKADFLSYAHYQDMTPLDQINIGRKMVIYGSSSGNDNHQQIASEVKNRGISIIGYNLEGQQTKEEFLRQEQEAYQAAKANGLTFVFGPTAGALQLYYMDFVQYADVIVFQTQRYQHQDDYAQVVIELIDKIKAVKPSIQIWAQVSVNPPDEKDIASDKVAAQIQAIEHKAELVFIFYDPANEPVMEEVFTKYLAGDSFATPTPTIPQCQKKGEGDANCDGKIDGVDYSFWLNNQCHPAMNQTCNDYTADFNSDMNIDGADYLIWYNHRI